MDIAKLLEFVRRAQEHVSQYERAPADYKPSVVTNAIDDLGPHLVDLFAERMLDDRRSFRRGLVLDCLHAVGEFDDGDFGEILERRVRSALKLVAKLDAEDRPEGSAVGRQVLESALADPRLEFLEEALAMWRGAVSDEARRQVESHFFCTIAERT